MFIKTAFVEIFGLEIEVFYSLEAFEFVCFPEAYLSVFRNTDHLTLFINENQFHELTSVNPNILCKKRMGSHIIYHNIPLLATYCQELQLVTKGRTNNCNIFWPISNLIRFIIRANCRLTILVPFFLEIDRLVHFKKAGMKRYESAYVLIKLNSRNWFDQLIWRTFLVWNLLHPVFWHFKFIDSFHKPFWGGVDHHYMHLSSTNQHSDKLMVNFMQTHGYICYNKVPIVNLVYLVHFEIIFMVNSLKTKQFGITVNKTTHQKSQFFVVATRGNWRNLWLVFFSIGWPTRCILNLLKLVNLKHFGQIVFAALQLGKLSPTRFIHSGRKCLSFPLHLFERRNISES